ncbi:hypothetical protein HP567_012750 [Brevibacillus sp. M2.1A]|uniref:hypothetical protein n=1 Tax=Brevibacillus sp. M2.1A TaxID=2738980 RepID=UPI00156B8B38|nr:hypothetical protein [Brevibacillus sp. M2.1A]MCC8435416.1 hypothetical protein [Brevibacillus sp. M2.1A]
MEEKYSFFIEVADELDELTFEGFFGEDVRSLVKERDFLSQEEYFVKILQGWNSDLEQYGKNTVKQYMIMFMDLYLNTIKINPQKAIEILSAYWRGTEDNPELAGISGYSEAVRYHVDAMNLLREFSQKEPRKLSEKKLIASSFITSYSKSIEYIGQILVPCLQMAKLTNGIDENAVNLMGLTLYEKIQMFNRETSNKYVDLTKGINRNIRNADAHLSLRYVPSKDSLELKVRKGGKISLVLIPINKWILEIYPIPGWIIQAYIYSGCLLCLGMINKQLFAEMYDQIFRDSK